MKKRIQILLLVLTIAVMHPSRAEAHLEPIPADGSNGDPVMYNGEPVTTYVGRSWDPDSLIESYILDYYQTLMNGYSVAGCNSLDDYMRIIGVSYTQEHVDYVLSLLGLTQEQANAYNVRSESKGSGLNSTNNISSECDHTYDEKVSQEATCAEPGEITYTCSKCGDSYTEEIPATGEHKYKEEITIEASCTHTGVLTSTCSICGAHTSKIIPRLEHQYSAETTTPASCEKDGVITYTCTLCGDSYKESIPHTGHLEGEGVITKSATLFSSGIIEYHCTECGDCLRKENVPSKIQAFWGK